MKPKVGRLYQIISSKGLYARPTKGYNMVPLDKGTIVFLTQCKRNQSLYRSETYRVKYLVGDKFYYFTDDPEFQQFNNSFREYEI